MTPADKLAAAEARKLFEREVGDGKGGFDLTRAALLIAAEEEPGRCDVGRCLSELERFGREACSRVEANPGAPLAALNRYVFGELGFAGNQADYYDPRNSMLHQVVSRRTGIPITLSLVYVEIARGAGLSAEGVGLPGHFIVRARAEGESATLVDPFHGQAIDEGDCQQRLDLIYGGKVPLIPEHLRAATPRDILVRILSNLKAIYVQGQLFRRALSAVERILLLAPHSAEELRDRGMLRAQLGRLDAAAADLRRYLERAADAQDAQQVREYLQKLQVRHSMLN